MSAMKPAVWQRAVLAGLMALGVVGGSLTPLLAGHASARDGWVCVRTPEGDRICIREQN